jgi:hypothetical protein
MPIGIGMHGWDDPPDDDNEGGLGARILAPKPGTWYFHSESDPRWRASGRAKVGGAAFGLMPEEAKQEIERLKKLYGEPPTDLTYGYYKD